MFKRMSRVQLSRAAHKSTRKLTCMVAVLALMVAVLAQPATAQSRHCNTWYNDQKVAEGYSTWSGPTSLSLWEVDVVGYVRYHTTQYVQSKVDGPADYSRPRTPRTKATHYGSIVTRTIQHDRTQIRFEIEVRGVSITVTKTVSTTSWVRSGPSATGRTGACWYYTRRTASGAMWWWWRLMDARST